MLLDCTKLPTSRDVRVMGLMAVGKSNVLMRRCCPSTDYFVGGGSEEIMKFTSKPAIRDEAKNSKKYASACQ